jgi:hypothetical protein
MTTWSYPARAPGSSSAEARDTCERAPGYARAVHTAYLGDGARQRTWGRRHAPGVGPRGWQQPHRGRYRHRCLPRRCHPGPDRPLHLAACSLTEGMAMRQDIEFDVGGVTLRGWLYSKKCCGYPVRIPTTAPSAGRTQPTVRPSASFSVRASVNLNPVPCGEALREIRGDPGTGLCGVKQPIPVCHPTRPPSDG